MSFEVVSEKGYEDYEIWTCDVCGYQIQLQGVGGDVACCPKCIENECSEAKEEIEHILDENQKITKDNVLKLKCNQCKVSPRISCTDCGYYGLRSQAMTK